MDEISLREVTASTVRSITSLRVADAQQKFVATNAESIAQAYFHPEAWFRAIYAGEEPVGFVMVEDPSLLDEPKDEPICLWRFMIDQRYQGTGVGRRALDLVVEHVRTRDRHGYMLTSCVPGEGSPLEFYKKYGFTETGEVMDGEIVLRYELT